MAGFRYFNIFKAAEGDISFDSFIQFPLAIFRMCFFNFDRKCATQALKFKALNHAKIMFCISGLITNAVVIFQLIAYSYEHSKNITETASAIGNASSGALIFVKGLITFLRRDDI